MDIQMSEWQEIQICASKLWKNDPLLFLKIYANLKYGAKKRSGFEGEFKSIEAYEYEETDAEGYRVLDDLGMPIMLTIWTAKYDMPTKVGNNG